MSTQDIPPSGSAEPTDDDLEAIFVDWAEWPDEDSDRVLDRSTFVSAARDVLARWGRHTSQEDLGDG